MDINCTKCPNCAGQLQTNVQQRKKICMFCDAEFVIDENITMSSQELETEPVVQVSKKYKIVLHSTPDKVKAIKAFRELSGCGLKEAKEVVDHIPAVLFDGLEKETAEHYVVVFKRTDPVGNIEIQLSDK